MPDDHNPAQSVGGEPPFSTTDEVLRLFREHRKAANGDDALDNPELEQLFCSLSKGLDEGIPESAPGVQPAGTLTLEDLAAGLVPPLALGEISPAQPDREHVVACPACGSANPAATHFCGMCGHELAKSESATAGVSGNGAESATALRAVPEAATTQPAAAAGRSSRWGLKLAFLVLGSIILGLVVYQRLLWREPLLVKWISNLPAMLSLKSSAVTTPAPVKTPAHPAPEAPLPIPVIRQPNTLARPPRTAPPITVRQPLPGPALEDSPVPQPAELPAAIHASDTAAPVAVAPVPTEHAPVQAAPTPPPPAPVKVSEGVAQGGLIFKVNPEYPAVARAARIQGSVLMHAIIGTDGSVQRLQAINGNPLLLRSAMEAVKRWRYRPYLLDGKPVEVETSITVNFKGE